MSKKYTNIDGIPHIYESRNISVNNETAYSGGNDGGNTRLDRLDSKVERINDSVTELRVSVSRLDESVTNIKTNIIEIKQDIKLLSKSITGIYRWMGLGAVGLFLGMLYMPYIQRHLNIIDNNQTQQVQEIKK